MEGQAGNRPPKVEADEALAQLHIPYPHLDMCPTSACFLASLTTVDIALLVVECLSLWAVKVHIAAWRRNGLLRCMTESIKVTRKLLCTFLGYLVILSFPLIWKAQVLR